MYLDCQLFIIVIKAIQPDCDKVKGISVLLLETPLTRSKYIFPIHTRTTTYANFKNLLHIRDTPTNSPTKELFIGGESDVPWKERQILDLDRIVNSGLRPYSDFSKHSRKSRTVASASNRIQRRVHTHGSQIYKEKR